MTVCTWNTADAGSNLTFSPDLLTVTSTSSSGSCVRSTVSWVGGSGASNSSYIRYQELSFSNTGLCGMGISNQGEPTSDYLGGTSHGVGYYSNSHVAIQATDVVNYATFSAPITVGMVTRFANQKAWWTLDGVTFNDDVITNQNPIANIGGFDIGFYSAGGGVFGDSSSWADVYAALGSLASGNSATANFGATPFVYNPLFGKVVSIGGLAWDGTIRALGGGFWFAA